MTDVRNAGFIKTVKLWNLLRELKIFHLECYKIYSILNKVKRAEKIINNLNNYKQSTQIKLGRKIGRSCFKQGNKLENEEQAMLRRS